MQSAVPKNSYEAFVQSIERQLLPDVEFPESGSRLASSIDRIMIDEARGGELRLAQLRLLVVAPYLLISVWLYLQRQAQLPLTAFLPPLILGLAWLLASMALVQVLRRGWYARWLPHVAPVADAVMMLSGFVLWRRLHGTDPGEYQLQLMIYVTGMCAFLSLSGALRLSRWAARAGAVLSVSVFVIAAAISRADLLLSAGVVIMLLATGLLGASVTTLVRRVITDEVARVTLTRLFHQAEETIDAREQVLKIVSHDLRNPLHTISMSAALLLEVPQSPEKQAEHLRRVKRAGERMNRLIQDLMDAAKLEAGRVGVDATLIQVAPLMREAEEMLSPLAAEKGIRFEAHTADNLPPITADAGRILQILSNLVGNAIKFTPAGGSVTIRADSAPGGVRFSVTDTGQGIPPDQLGKIFGQFWQANPSDRRGIGLGLTIAKGIVEAHGGRIWVESTLGAGTSFYFTLATELPPNVSGPRERRREQIETQMLA